MARRLRSVVSLWLGADKQVARMRVAMHKALREYHHGESGRKQRRNLSWPQTQCSDAIRIRELYAIDELHGEDVTT